jgi:hypothetical protein
MERLTIFSPDRLYRYTLWRQWSGDFWFDDVEPDEACAGNQFKYVMFIGLNPSTADETKDDPTIRRCIAFSKAWGYGAMCMTNVFAFRATDPKVMMAHPSPVGEHNHSWILRVASKAGLVVAAWGTKGRHMHQDLNVSQWLRAIEVPIMCLRKTNDGSPEHPLYLPKTLTPIPL